MRNTKLALAFALAVALAPATQAAKLALVGGTLVDGALCDPIRDSLVLVDGTPRAVQRLFVHPRYRASPQAIVDAALASGEWEACFAFVAASDDLALVQLAEPVTDVTPVRIHADAVPATIVRIMGRGATGTGPTGLSLRGPNRTERRQGCNRISESEGRWIGFRLDAPPDAMRLEASIGSGDSGGSILGAVDDERQVAGIAAWKRGQVVGTALKPGCYGEIAYGVRLAHYRRWIEAKIAAGDAD